MGSVSLHAAVPVGLLVGVLAACASASQTSQGELAATPSGDTAAVSQSDSATGPQRSGHEASTVTGEDIRRQSGRPIEEILAGRVAGVSVYQTGDGIAVRIHGVSSFMGSNEPLYVIDGIPVRAGPGGALRGISPYDIESIVVLKDPVDTALYGVRGANGVIVITTTRP